MDLYNNRERIDEENPIICEIKENPRINFIKNPKINIL